MPLFTGWRDAQLVSKFNKELIIDVIDTEIALYKLSLSDTKTDMYGESDSKIYHQPVMISALINRQDPVYEGTEEGQDYTMMCDFGFIKDSLIELGVYVEVGDAIEYNGEWYEVDSVIDNKYFGGKNPEYSFASDRWGLNVSIIANAHLTRRSRIHVEEIRSANRSTDNDIPLNI